ncbi:unnamed protein product, partial [Meganyctiphanes norvegica]
MLDSCIHNFLDNIVPCSEKSRHDTLRLEYLSACVIMVNTNYTMKILPIIPASLFVPLLQSVIYKYYLEFMKMDGIFKWESYYDPFICDTETEPETDALPETLRILILHWPHEELILRKEIPLLDPPIERFLCRNSPYAYHERMTLCQIEKMLTIYHTFCNRLIQCIMQAVFKCTLSNIYGFACNIKRIDVSGLGCFNSSNHSIKCFAPPQDILKDIHNSTMDTFGHKIEIFADAELILSKKNVFNLLRNIIEESLNPKVGISVYFKKITA